MRKLDDYSDERLKGACIHCGRGLSGNKTNKEHLPTKSLLTEPYPINSIHLLCIRNATPSFRLTKSTSALS